MLIGRELGRFCGREGRRCGELISLERVLYRPGHARDDPQALCCHRAPASAICDSIDSLNPPDCGDSLLARAVLVAQAGWCARYRSLNAALDCTRHPALPATANQSASNGGAEATTRFAAIHGCPPECPAGFGGPSPCFVP